MDLYEPSCSLLDPPLIHRCTVIEPGQISFTCRLGPPHKGPFWDSHPGFHVVMNQDGMWTTEVRGEVWEAYVIST